MKANEVRIGNFYSHRGDQEWTIKPLDIVDMVSRPQDGVNIIYRPIALTEEWLLKFGFEKEDDAGNWHQPEYSIYSTKNNFKIGVEHGQSFYYNYAEDDLYSSYFPRLDSVHQLQNLYFALTGEELKLQS